MQHTHTHGLHLGIVVTIAVLTLGGGVRTQVRSGSTPGTERWLVRLGGRSFSLAERFTTIRGEPDGARRAALVGQIADSARADHDDFARFATGRGFTVAEHYWTINACVVEVPPGRAGELRAHRHVLALCPDEARALGVVSARVFAAGPPVPPRQGAAPNGTEPDDHGVSAAHGYIGYGAGARVAVFDTGVDLDQSGTGTSPDPDVHHALRDAAGGSRATNHLVEPAAGIECNSTTPGIRSVRPIPIRPDERLTSRTTSLRGCSARLGQARGGAKSRRTLATAWRAAAARWAAA